MKEESGAHIAADDWRTCTEREMCPNILMSASAQRKRRGEKEAAAGTESRCETRLAKKSQSAFPTAGLGEAGQKPAS